ncbi:hypothetical protein ACTXT7_012379 [Hymenolepis weldensis]
MQLETVVEIANKLKVTPVQVLVRHALQRNIVIIAKSVTPERTRKNYDAILDFQLTEEEMDKPIGASMNKRLFEVPAFAEHPEYPFHDEF